jgi:GntR family transcriptional regulator
MTPHSPRIFSIVPSSNEPIYRQLVGQVRRLVAGGQLAPGDVLPSVREISQELVLNPMTVSKAWSILEAEGVLKRRRGAGMYVAERSAGLDATEWRIDLLRRTLERAVLEARQLETPLETILTIIEEIYKEQE